MQLAREERSEACPSLGEVYAATAESVPMARESLTAFAAGAGAYGDELEEIRLAVSEAVTNVVIHAYRDLGGYIYLTAAMAGDELWILVTDDGGGLHPGSNGGGLGFGLGLISQLSDEFSIVQRASGGTEVRMRFTLRSSKMAPAGHGRGSRSSARSPAARTFSTIT